MRDRLTKRRDAALVFHPRVRTLLRIKQYWLGRVNGANVYN